MSPWQYFSGGYRASRLGGQVNKTFIKENTLPYNDQYDKIRKINMVMTLRTNMMKAVTKCKYRSDEKR